MKLNRNGVGVLLSLLSAAGCTPAESPQTVSWYQSHAEARRVMVQDCSDNPGESKHDADCTNALRAEAIEGVGSLKDLPPMNLGAPRKLIDKPPKDASGAPPP